MLRGFDPASRRPKSATRCSTIRALLQMLVDPLGRTVVEALPRPKELRVWSVGCESLNAWPSSGLRKRVERLFLKRKGRFLRRICCEDRSLPQKLAGSALYRLITQDSGHFSAFSERANSPGDAPTGTPSSPHCRNASRVARVNSLRRAARDCRLIRMDRLIDRSFGRLDDRSHSASGFGAGIHGTTGWTEALHRVVRRILTRLLGIETDPDHGRVTRTFGHRQLGVRVADRDTGRPVPSEASQITTRRGLV